MSHAGKDDKLIPAIIFADCQGDLNHPTALLTIKGRYFLKHLLDRIKIAGLGGLYMFSGAQTIPVSERIKVDQAGDPGNLESVITTALAEQKDAAGFFIFSVSQPLIATMLLKRMADKFTLEPGRSIVPSFKGREGSPFIITRKQIEEMQNRSTAGFDDLFKAALADPTLLPVEDERVCLHVGSVDDYESYLLRHKVLLRQDYL